MSMTWPVLVVAFPILKFLICPSLTFSGHRLPCPYLCPYSCHCNVLVVAWPLPCLRNCPSAFAVLSVPCPGICPALFFRMPSHMISCCVCCVSLSCVLHCMLRHCLRMSVHVWSRLSMYCPCVMTWSRCPVMRLASPCHSCPITVRAWPFSFDVLYSIFR